MIFNGFYAATIGSLLFILSGCNSSSFQSDFSSREPAASEPAYYGTPTAIADANAVNVKIAAKFLYRNLNFSDTAGYGLGSVVPSSSAVAIPFVEYHVYDSSLNRIQQGETTTSGIADFKIPKVAGTYTLRVFSRAYNDYVKVSVLQDPYSNTPYSIVKTFTVTTSDLAAGTLDLSSSPVYAEADENISSAIEGGAFNIYFDIVIANEYIRRNIQKNNNGTGVPVADSTKWWVADKVTMFWKAGFNPYTYFGGTDPLSFYVPGEHDLYILGGSSGDVKVSDTDHFDDSIVLHEYGHFLEDTYGRSGSPGGSHSGNFIIDPRLAWSEGWADYLQSAILTGADASENSASEDRIPPTKRYHFYVDTAGYNRTTVDEGLKIAFNLAASGNDSTQPDAVTSDVAGSGIFREVSIARTLYKSTRKTTELYGLAKAGGGVSFVDVWKVFAGENTTGSDRLNPLTYSFRNSTSYPIPNSGLFNWLLSKNGVAGAEWDAILTEEKQNKNTADYAYLLTSNTCAATVLGAAALETGYKMHPVYDPVNHSHQQKNNDFYLYYYDGTNTTLSMTYTESGNAPDLDLILYYGSYVYFEDDYWYAGQTSSFVAKSSRTVGTAEQISLNGLPSGYYILNVKVNAYNKTSAEMSGNSSYKIFKNGSQLCGTEQP